ncbi:hypothetical protein [Paenibacillus sp. PastF-2]|nr:hypothetical protein [Paenibacillus sp. PastF-2]MDF9840411.1 divalent metal cation (Fe/Co/Zn/Cd) transporter [Paenibacillus sp. PastF-2]
MSMDNPATGNITYFSVLKICYRIYGVYLFVTGFLDILSYGAYFLSLEVYLQLLVMAKIEDLVTAVLTLLSGIVIVVLSGKLSARIADKQQELSLAADQLQHIVYYALHFVLTMVLVPLTVYILAGIAVLFYGVAEGLDWSQITIIVMMLILWCFLILAKKSCRRLVRFFMK